MGFEAVFFVMMGILGGNAGDLADYAATDVYWQAREQRIVDVTTMSAVLAGEDATPTDQLMAIRALGELGKAKDADKQAILKVLTPLVDSKEPFVGIYAKRSIAWVNGKEPAAIPKPTAAELEKDLALLPANAQIVGQFKVNPTNQPVDVATLLPDMSAFGGGPGQQEEMVAQASKGIVEFLMKTGNLRIDAISLGLHFTGKGDNGFAVLVGRGQYDPISVQIAMEELAKAEGQDFKSYSIGDVEVIANNTRRDPFALLMPSDKEIILMFGEPGEQGAALFPVAETAKLYANADRKPVFSDRIAEQAKLVDRAKSDVWVAFEPAGPFLSTELVAVFGAFDAGHISAIGDGKGRMDVSWRAQGSDGAKVTEVVKYIQSGVTEGVTQMKQMMNQAPQMKAMFEPTMKMMESIKVEQDGKTMTGGMKMDPSNLMSPFFLMSGVRALEGAGAIGP